MQRWIIAVATEVGAWWVRRQERDIGHRGVALTPAQAAAALALGVREPARVRVLRFADFPAGLPWVLAWAAPLVRRAARGTVGIALGHGVLLRTDVADDPGLLRHELVHIAQYERLGVRGFLRAYLRECAAPGYPHGPLEQEARRRSIDLKSEI